MLWIVSFIVGVIVTLSLLITAIRKLRNERKNDWNLSGADLRAKLVSGRGMLLISLALIGIWPIGHTFFSSFQRIPAGQVGVVKEFGAITGQIPEGATFIAPWKDIDIASTQVQRTKFEQINAFSNETQDVFITATLNYQISPLAVQGLYRNVGPNWFEKLVESRVLQFFKDEAVTYNTVDIAPAREKIRIAVRERLDKALAPYSIEVVDLLIDDIDFTPEFKKAIEAKQVATQDALRAKEIVQQKIQEAQQKVEEARGDARSTRIRASGQADANKKLAKSITPELIQWQAIEKLGDNIDAIIAPPGTFFDLSKLLGTQSVTEEPATKTAPSGK